MRNIFFILLLLAFTLHTAAQQTPKKTGIYHITGHVTDSITGKAVEYATITLYRLKTEKPVDGTVSSAEGIFELEPADSGTYKIIAEFIGYRPVTVPGIRLSKQHPDSNLHIILSVTGITLQAVTVSASTSLVENKIDKLVFNAEKDLTSQGGVATDILKKVPQVSVDVDGNVELAGSTSVRFLINGKPSTAFGSRIADVLQSIPASQIKSIEVITNPGARYDAQGIGGIINIILKQNRMRGVNGNVSLTAGTRNENGSLNLNIRKGEFGINAFASANTRLPAIITNSSDRESVDTGAKENISLIQSGNNRFKRHGIESGMGFDYTYRKKNNFNGSFRYGSFGNSGSGNNSLSQITSNQADGSIRSSFNAINSAGNHSDFYNTDLSLGYKRTFKEDQELEFSYNSSFEDSRSRSDNNQWLQPQDSLIYGIITSNPGRQKEQELQADYSQVLNNDITLGLGGKFINTRVISQSAISAFEPLGGLYQYDSALSINLDYKQTVYALYSEISFHAGKLFDTKIGGRYERTEINSYYSNAQQQTGKHGYNTFVPSLFFSRKLGASQLLKLSYTKRIERPDYEDLNPFINTTDPKNISAGNPYLLPETGHRVELSYSRSFEKAGNFMITAFFRNNQHDIQPFIQFYPTLIVGDSIYTNVAVSMRLNIGTENNMGLNGFIDLHPGEKLAIRSNLSFFKRHTINAINKGYNSNSFNYRTNINISYQFGKTLAGEFFGSFNSARNEAQGKYPSFTSYSFAIRKQFWNKKGSLALNAINPFSEYVSQRTELFGPGFTVNSLRKIPFRSIGLNFTWKFGKLEFKKDTNENKDPAAGMQE